MASGSYGTIRPADVSANDVDIFYTYSPNIYTPVSQVKRLDPTVVLQKFDHPDYSNRILGGMYQLNLPTTIFNAVGSYNVNIRPKEINCRILDCGVLSSNNSIRGIIIDLQDIPAEFQSNFENNSLIGYRIEYYNTDTNVNEKKIQNMYRVVTSNFKVEPINENINNTTQRAIRYRLNDNSTLVFCTLTPSTAPSINPNAVPFIGLPNQRIIVTNTFFDPIVVPIEIVENDMDTLAIGLFGNQSKSVSDGIRTYYNENNEIYKQFNEFVIKDDTNNPLYEVKEERDNIDFTKNLDDITNI